MNEKPFFEVFRTLQVDGQLHSLFEQVMVTRVSTNPRRDVLRVYIVSKKLIAKDQLFHIAKQIQRQVFGTRKTQVYLFEKFQLSEQYTPEKLWDLYEDSVLIELEAYSPYKRSIMKNAKVEFPDEHNMRVTVSDQVYDKEAVDDILRILDRVFNERCGFQVKVDVNYVDLKEHKSLEKSEAQMRQRISFLTESLMKEKEAKAESGKQPGKRQRQQALPVGNHREIVPEQHPVPVEVHQFKKIQVALAVRNLLAADGSAEKAAAAVSGEVITRMCFMDVILRMKRLKSKKSTDRSEKLLFAEKFFR